MTDELREAAQDYFDHSPLPNDPSTDEFHRLAWQSRHRLADALAATPPTLDAGLTAALREAARELVNSLVTMDAQTCAVATDKFVALTEAHARLPAPTTAGLDVERLIRALSAADGDRRPPSKGLTAELRPSAERIAAEYARLSVLPTSDDKP